MVLRIDRLAQMGFMARTAALRSPALEPLVGLNEAASKIKVINVGTTEDLGCPDNAIVKEQLKMKEDKFRRALISIVEEEAYEGYSYANQCVAQCVPALRRSKNDRCLESKIEQGTQTESRFSVGLAKSPAHAASSAVGSLPGNPYSGENFLTDEDAA